jgi:hypothetical protein
MKWDHLEERGKTEIFCESANRIEDKSPLAGLCEQGGRKVGNFVD